MTGARRPPRLLVKTLAVTFVTVALLLVVVFVFVTLSVRGQVRQSVTANLESSQRLFAALETRRQKEMQMQASALAESPTLKAALDTYQTESRRSSDDSVHGYLLATIDNELRKVAAVAESDALVLVDTRQNTIGAAGRFADRWPRGRAASFAGGTDGSAFDGIARAANGVFRVVAVPLRLDDGSKIGTFYAATSLDQAYVDELARLAGSRIAIVSGGRVLASTLTPQAAREFESHVASTTPTEGTMALDGELHAFRRLVAVGDTSFYALGSIDELSRSTQRAAMRTMAFIAIGAAALALIGSFWLARLLTEPIDRLSTSLAAMAASHDVMTRLPMTGSSREVDVLTETFNALMASVAEAEAQTEAAYTGAIRALAAALDARDPYTAGHSERVSVLSVAIGRTLGLPADELDVLRLGALLHDIGKIGVPDHVLRKPGALTNAEFATIREHPVLGARILHLVPFLARHLPIVELHHERPDGRGYPYGLQGDDIPLDARIVHVADAYDAMTSARAYRRARPSREALRELWRCAGSEFDAEIVGALANALPGITTDAGQLVLESA
ncbi:MAG TPA: HD domain-containing phosphohydrolase [Vicinamibacterales bacterium]|nr:HD domain-containing phosphohydrolase [Vicinamibacterales bacterium]